MHLSKHYVVISAELEGLSKTENALRSQNLVADLFDLCKWDAAVVPCEGSWNGRQEQSYAVFMPEDPSTEVSVRLRYGLIELGVRYSQDCILAVFDDDPQTCTFYPTNGGTEYQNTYFPWIELDEYDEVQGDYLELLGVRFVADLNSPMDIFGEELNLEIAE